MRARAADLVAMNALANVGGNASSRYQCAVRSSQVVQPPVRHFIPALGFANVIDRLIESLLPFGEALDRRYASRLHAKAVFVVCAHAEVLADLTRQRHGVVNFRFISRCRDDQGAARNLLSGSLGNLVPALAAEQEGANTASVGLWNIRLLQSSPEIPDLDVIEEAFALSLFRSNVLHSANDG